jgi:hypothetical protein
MHDAALHDDADCGFLRPFLVSELILVSMAASWDLPDEPSRTAQPSN